MSVPPAQAFRVEVGSRQGVAWHTLRHEFCSRTAENTRDPAVAQELGTSQGPADDAAVRASPFVAGPRSGGSPKPPRIHVRWSDAAQFRSPSATERSLAT